MQKNNSDQNKNKHCNENVTAALHSKKRTYLSPKIIPIDTNTNIEGGNTRYMAENTNGNGLMIS